MFALSVSCFIFATIFSAGYPQKLGRGRCPQTQAVQDFDVTRYLGKWYEIQKYPNLFQRGNCVEANYGPLSNDGRVGVINKEVSTNRVNAVRGFAEMKQFGSGNLLVTLKTPIIGNTQSNYDVLGTDYNNWALVHACREILGFKAEFAWILSRQRFLSPDDRQRIDELIYYNGLEPASFQVTDQSNCPNVDSLPFSYIA